MLTIILCSLSDLVESKGNLAMLFTLGILCLCHLGCASMDLVRVICSTVWGEDVSARWTLSGSFEVPLGAR